MPAQNLRPGTWCRESTEQLGRVAVAATVAKTAAAMLASRREGKEGVEHNIISDVARVNKIGDDGLRRCGRPRPPLFQPTTWKREQFIGPRAKGEVRERKRGTPRSVDVS